MAYETLAKIAQQAGTVYFVAIFLAGSAYGLWPRNRDVFRKAARTPLDEEEL